MSSPKKESPKAKTYADAVTPPASPTGAGTQSPPAFVAPKPVTEMEPFPPITSETRTTSPLST